MISPAWADGVDSPCARVQQHPTCPNLEISGVRVRVRIGLRGRGRGRGRVRVRVRVSLEAAFRSASPRRSLK